MSSRRQNTRFDRLSKRGDVAFQRADPLGSPRGLVRASCVFPKSDAAAAGLIRRPAASATVGIPSPLFAAQPQTSGSSPGHADGGRCATLRSAPVERTAHASCGPGGAISAASMPPTEELSKMPSDRATWPGRRARSPPPLFATGPYQRGRRPTGVCRGSGFTRHHRGEIATQTKPKANSKNERSEPCQERRITTAQLTPDCQRAY